MKDLFEKLAIGGVVPVYADNGELMMHADEQQFAELQKFSNFMTVAMTPVKAPQPATHPHVAKLKHSGVVAVYGDNGEHKANLSASCLAEYTNVTGARHDSHNFEPQQAWQKRFSPDF